MTLEMVVVFAVLVAAVILFATEKLPVDLVAILVMAVLLIAGIISPEEGIAGFSNMATVIVGVMFIISAGLYRTGAVNALGFGLAAIGKKSFGASVILIVFFMGVLSAFMSNTAAVAVFIPIVIGMANKNGSSISRLLMPMSFAAMFGGTCTLIGTSTNILVSSIAETHGQKPFAMFEFAPMGLVFFVAGSLYMLLWGIRMIPDRRRGGDLTDAFAMEDYLTEIVLDAEAKSVGKTVREAPIVHELDLTILNLRRNGVSLGLPGPEMVLIENDVLLVRCNIEKIKKLGERQGVLLKPKMRLRDSDLNSDHLMLAEAIIAPNSMLVGRSIKSVQFRNIFGAVVLAIRHRGGAVLHEKIFTTRLKSGDALLIEVERKGYEQFKNNREFVVVSEINTPQFRSRKILPAILIVAGMVITAATGLLPLVVSAIAAALLLVLAGCIKLEEAYQAVEWKIIFLLAGVLTLGTALEKTGAAAFIADRLVDTIGGLGPVAILSSFYLITSLLTSVMSNNAAAALLAPVAIATAVSLGVDSRPFLFAVAFAASASFMTPIGYQTNTMIYAAGQYRFADFLKVGTPLTVLFWMLATFLIPLFWPF